MSQPFTYEHQTARIPATATQADPWHYAKTAHPVLTAGRLSRSNTFSIGVSAARWSFINGSAPLVNHVTLVLTATRGNLCLEGDSPITSNLAELKTVANSYLRRDVSELAIFELAGVVHRLFETDLNPVAFTNAALNNYDR
jgi:hypothetical protein